MSDSTHRLERPVPNLPEVDVFEKGAPIDGEPQRMNRRLFMQLLVYHVPAEGPGVHDTVHTIKRGLEQAGMGGVVYKDVNDPRGLGLLTYSEDPADFVTKVRPLFASGSLAQLKLRPEFTMLGRSYSGGYEADLPFWIIERPKKNVSNPEWPWAVWYPLRRSGAFAQLEGREQGKILREHAFIGRAYGQQDLAHDVRLACHGLDANDNEFVIGLVGKGLHPLSHVVQRMRSTAQTSQYINQMGPFFVGHIAAITKAAGLGSPFPQASGARWWPAWAFLPPRAAG